MGRLLRFGIDLKQLSLAVSPTTFSFFFRIELHGGRVFTMLHRLFCHFNFIQNIFSLLEILIVVCFLRIKAASPLLTINNLTRPHCVLEDRLDRITPCLIDIIDLLAQ